MRTILKNNQQQRQNRREDGFTIVELMIATSIFSVILVLATTMMIGIGRLYTKGINQSRIQTTVRSVADDLSQHLQLNSLGWTAGSPAGPHVLPPVGGTGTAIPVQAICIGTTRYSYVLNRQVGSDTDDLDQVPHALWRDTVSPGSCENTVVMTDDYPRASSGGGPLTPTIDGTELIAPNAFLTELSIVGATSPYHLSVGVAYGDTELLNLAGTNTTCRGDIGQEFCATASLQTTVLQRL